MFPVSQSGENIDGKEEGECMAWEHSGSFDNFAMNLKILKKKLSLFKFFHGLKLQILCLYLTLSLSIHSAAHSPMS